MVNEGRVTTSRSDGVETISGKGELTLYVVEQFKQALFDAVASGNEIVVDFRQTSYIDTAFVAALVTPAKARLEQASRLKVLVTEGSHPQYVLKISGFPDLMDIVAEKSSAPT